MSTDREDDKSEPQWRWWMVGVGFTVSAIFIALAYVQYFIVEHHVQGTENDPISKFGVSGDFFGMANAVFSALAFAMIIVTLWMQKPELKQQGKDKTERILVRGSSR